MRWLLPMLIAACVNPSATGDDTVAPDAGADGADPSCDPTVTIDPMAARPATVMPTDRLARVAARAPRVACGWLHDVLESPDTMWSDLHSIVPGYQDSFGDNVVAPIGFRPNTIDSGLIDLAVPGGHAQLFVDKGLFHFPFGRPIAHQGDNLIVNFLKLPRDAAGLEPVVWWRRDPNAYTHRYEWLFPKGTVIGELLLLERDDGEWFPFEIRARVRELDKWRVEVLRPFPTAASLADALEAKRTERPAWQAAEDITALIEHLRDPARLTAHTTTTSHFNGSFPTLAGAEDALPGVADATILEQLLVETPFVTARDQVWKQANGLTTYAATTQAPFHIVPRNYDGGMLKVDDETCTRCHEHAGRPFKDYYDNVLAYGELWGMDDVFTWHPFRTDRFVNASGSVVNFNYDNRELRQDFIDGGVLAPFDAATHGLDRYQRLPGAWKGFSY